MQSKKITIHHDSQELDIISAFAAAIKPFGLFVEDLTQDDTETVDVRVTDTKPEKEWSC